MPLDFTGIHNEGEFYSHHDLSTVLEGDLKPLFERWSAAEKAGGARSPERRLASLATRYFQSLYQAENARGAGAVSELFGRGQASGYRTMAGLLHRDALLRW